MVPFLPFQLLIWRSYDICKLKEMTLQEVRFNEENTNSCNENTMDLIRIATHIFNYNIFTSTEIIVLLLS